MEKKYTAAIIGAGALVGSGKKGGGHQIGYTHAAAYQGQPRVKLVAVADINAENRHAFQQKFGVEKGFADYRVMLGECRPDLVSICTYVGLHHEMIISAARAGAKGIFCEKPFITSPVALADVQRQAQETGVKITVAHIRRHLPAFIRARELYQSGAVGQPLMCIAGIAGWDLSECGSHWLDMFRFFHHDRPVRWVFGQARVRSLRGYGHAMEDHAVAYFEFDGGGKGILDGGMAMNGPWTMTLVGTEGTIRIQREDTVVLDTVAGRKTETFPADGAYIYIWRKMVSDLIDWIEGGAEPVTGLTNMAQSAELNLAAYISALRGDRIDLPLSGAAAAIDQWPVELLAQRNGLPRKNEGSGRK